MCVPSNKQSNFRQIILKSITWNYCVNLHRNIFQKEAVHKLRKAKIVIFMTLFFTPVTLSLKYIDGEACIHCYKARRQI